MTETPRLRVALAVVLAAGALACGEEAPPSTQAPIVEDPGPIHVHGLGVNPSDGALFVATHTGLFRTGAQETEAKRVADRYQDTMGFTVVGPDRFLGSGHPDGREHLPPFLGLIESTDAGVSWRPISLQGKADFHVLEAAGETVYGFGSDFQTREERLLVSANGGKDWEQRATPRPLTDLAIDPQQPEQIVAASERSLLGSSDGGRRWRTLGGGAGLLGWADTGRLFRVGAAGRVELSRDGGKRWRAVGEVGGEPAAFEADGPDDLYIALHDGTIKRSRDGGASWAVRSRP